MARKDFITKILELIDARINEDGLIDFDGISGVSLPYFIDWRTSDNKNAKQANPAFYLHILNSCKEMFNVLSVNELYTTIIGKIGKFQPEIFSVTQFDSFALLENKVDQKKALEALLLKAEIDLSTFSSYYILNAIFKYEPNKAIEIMKNYFGAMINLGATTFFEEFESSWKNSIKIDDIPNGSYNFLIDSGKWCYEV